MIDMIEYMLIEDLKSDRYQTRAAMDPESLADLADSIRRNGVINPLLVELGIEGYSVVAGHRRLAAAILAGLECVPVIIIDQAKKNAWELALHENLVRTDLTPIEEAAAIKDCLQTGLYDTESLARAMRRSAAWIAERVAICEWPDNLQEAVHKGRISVAAAWNLARIADHEQRNLLIEYAAENGATARITAAWLQAYRAGLHVERPETIEAIEPTRSLERIEPYTPCVICDDKLRMVDLRYLPICPRCQDEVILQVRRQLKGQTSTDGRGA